jgi:hypothetical protein
MIRVGLISDTHGHLRPEAVTFLRGTDYIVHGGDVGMPDILTHLASLAPLTAVRGNNDHGLWADTLRQAEILEVGEVCIYVIHDRAELDFDPRSAGIHVVVSGHSHKPSIESYDGVLFVNPGSAGPRRFKLPISAGELVIDGSSVSARFIELELSS